MACGDNCTSNDIDNIREALSQEMDFPLADVEMENEQLDEREQAAINDLAEAIAKSEDAQKSFREQFEQRSNLQKGQWGEVATIAEAKSMGHSILSAHPDNPNFKGFDCVSYNTQERELHIWEAKNLGLTTQGVYERNLTAWKNDSERINEKGKKGERGEKDSKYEGYWKDLIQAASNDEDRQNIEQAVNEGRVFFHVRIGPDTRISPTLRDELDNTTVPGAKFDWDSYSYGDMLSLNRDDSGEGE